MFCKTTLTGSGVTDQHDGSFLLEQQIHEELDSGCFGGVYERGLQRHIGVQFELGDTLRPWLELLRLGVDVVIEHGPSRRELDRFELRHPPLGEVHSVISQLQEYKINKWSVTMETELIGGKLIVEVEHLVSHQN